MSKEPAAKSRWWTSPTAKRTLETPRPAAVGPSHVDDRGGAVHAHDRARADPAGQIHGDGAGSAADIEEAEAGTEVGQEVGGGILRRPPPMGPQDTLVVAVGVAVARGLAPGPSGAVSVVISPACAGALDISKVIIKIDGYKIMYVSTRAAQDLRGRLPGPVGHRGGPGAGPVPAGGQPAAGRPGEGRRSSPFRPDAARGRAHRPGRGPLRRDRLPRSISSKPFSADCEDPSVRSSAPLRLGSTAEFFSSLVLPRIGPARLAVVASFGDDGELLGQLERGEIDVAVTSAVPGRRSFEAVPIGQKRFVLVASPGLAPGAPSDHCSALGDWLVGQSWVAYSLELPITRRFWQTHLGRPFSARLRLVAPDLRAVTGAVERGMGCSILPRFVCARRPGGTESRGGASRLRSHSRRTLVRLLQGRRHGPGAGGRLRGTVRRVTIYIAMLRGINVSGRNRLAMDDLRTLVTDIGGTASGPTSRVGTPSSAAGDHRRPSPVLSRAGWRASWEPPLPWWCGRRTSSTA